jgi:hypothetical protein
MKLVRIITDPPRGADGLFIQPKDVSPERETIEQHNRCRFASHFHYADPFTGNTRTMDSTGNYRCGECNQEHGGKCLLVTVTKLDEHAGSCDHWEDRFAGDPEMRLDLMSPEKGGYAIAANGEGFGCHRCPYASKAHQPDSQGRTLYCGKGDMRVFANACCGLNGAKEVPIDKNGMPTSKVAPSTKHAKAHRWLNKR